MKRAISDPAAAAVITPSDVDRAVAQWKQDVPPQWKELLSAEPVEPPPKPGNARP